MTAVLLWFLGLSIPFAIRTTVLMDTIRGVQNPFITIYLYASDLILVGLCILLVYRGLFYQKQSLAIPIWFYALISAGIWTVWMSDYPWMSFLYLMRILICIYVYIYVHTFQLINTVWKGFVAGMIGQLVIALVQFGTQTSLGLPFVVEPVLDVSLGGVAKVEIFGRTLVRASGTFPHPNILAMALVLWVWRMSLSVIPTRLRIAWHMVLGLGILFAAQLDHYFITSVQGMLLGGLAVVLCLDASPIKSWRKPVVWKQMVMFILSCVLVVTFSKTAFALVFGGGLALLTLRRSPAMFHVEHFQYILNQRRIQAVLAVLIIGLWSVIGVAFWPTAENRLFYIGQTWNQLVDARGMGVGLGRFVSHLPLDLPFWRYQPVHSVPFLILAEVGFGIIIGLVVYTFLRYTRWYETFKSKDKLSDR